MKKGYHVDKTIYEGKRHEILTSQIGMKFMKRSMIGFVLLRKFLFFLVETYH